MDFVVGLFSPYFCLYHLVDLCKNCSLSLQFHQNRGQNRLMARG